MFSGATSYDVVAAPTEVVNTGFSEVLGSVILIVRGSGNVTGTFTGDPAQINIVYDVQIDNTTSGCQICQTLPAKCGVMTLGKRLLANALASSANGWSRSGQPTPARRTWIVSPARRTSRVSLSSTVRTLAENDRPGGTAIHSAVTMARVAGITAYVPLLEVIFQLMAAQSVAPLGDSEGW